MCICLYKNEIQKLSQSGVKLFRSAGILVTTNNVAINKGSPSPAPRTEPNLRTEKSRILYLIRSKTLSKNKKALNRLPVV